MPDGTLVLDSGRGAGGLRLLVRLARPIVISPFVKLDLRRFVSNPTSDDLEVLVGMVDEGSLRPVIDSTCPLAETAAALRHVEAGHARGRVVVVIGGPARGPGLSSPPAGRARRSAPRRRASSR